MPITISLERAAEESGLSVRTLNYAIANGELKSVTVGRRRLIPVRALESFLRTGSKMRKGGAPISAAESVSECHKKAADSPSAAEPEVRDGLETR